MKKIYILLCIAAILFIFTNVQKSQAEIELKPTRSYVKRADLVAGITFKYQKKDVESTQCYTLAPNITIINIGQSTACNFTCVVSYKYKSDTWKPVHISFYKTLLAGEAKKIIIPHEMYWCPNGRYPRPSVRVKVDTKNAVAESDENNNVAEKTFLSIPKTKTLQRR